ncbi:MAG: hypothetical protein ABI551_27335, partial [Polyangiaceae bacterium]
VAALATTTLNGCAGADGSDAVGQTDDEVTGGRIVVHHFGNPGPAVTKWGYDVKQPGRAKQLSAAEANEIFAVIGMNVLRIPVLAQDAHPSAGKVTGAEYADIVDAVAKVRAARPNADIFASLKLDGKNSFPGWVQAGGSVDADKYSVLLEDFLGFMKAKGVTVDWLGVDNESVFNEGNITPAKYDTIVANVRQWCKGHDVKVPGFIAGENYSPGLDIPWLQDLWNRPSRFDNVDHVGVHVYSKHRDGDYVKSVQNLANNDHGKGLWDTELHWNDVDGDDLKFDDIKLGMLTAFDHFDAGFHGITWWAFNPRSAGTKAAYVQSELVQTTAGAGLLDTDDRDGRGLGNDKFNTRAFKNGPNEVTLWVANYSNADRDGQVTEIENQKVTGASFVRWISAADPNGKGGNAKVTKDGDFKMSFPANTITRVTIAVK